MTTSTPMNVTRPGRCAGASLIVVPPAWWSLWKASSSLRTRVAANSAIDSPTSAALQRVRGAVVPEEGVGARGVEDRQHDDGDDDLAEVHAALVAGLEGRNEAADDRQDVDDRDDDA